MTARIIRKSKIDVTTEDAFGTPAASRSNMMNVAGKTDDELEQGEELLMDDNDDICENKVYRMTLGQIRKLLRQRMI